MINLKSIFKDSYVQKIYYEKSIDFAEAVSFLYIGECIGFKKILDKWDSWEKEYSNRGYKTISLDNFISASRGQDISKLLGQKLENTEKPIYHAEIYKNNYLGKVKPIINLEQMMKDGKMQSGVFELPSTKNSN